MTARSREFAADASFLINILSTRVAAELMGLAGIRLVLPPIAYAEVKRDRAELDRLIEDELAVILDLPDSSTPHLVQAAGVVDDGEAAVIALGIHRGCGFATDDGCAIDYLLEVVGVAASNIVGICELLQSVETQIGTERQRELLALVRTHANFAPPRRHAPWWRIVMERGREKD